jgi:glycosyltransferase involved in cell wall biosynthesis
MPSDALRIALISGHASPCAARGVRGPGADLEALVAALARRGHQIDLVARRDSPALPALVELQPGVRVLHVEAGPPAPVPEDRLLELVPEFARNATRLLATDDPRQSCDLLHADGAWPGFVGLRLARACGLPLAVGFRAEGLGGGDGAGDGAGDAVPPVFSERSGIERTLVQQADALIAASPQDRADLMRLYGARAARIHTVPRGVDAQLFTPGDKAQARLALGWADDAFTVLHVGALTPESGVDGVIEALARVPHALPMRLVVAGGDRAEAGADLAHLPRLQALAQQAGVADRVSFAGPRAGPALRQCCVAADVLVAVPWREPASSAVLEAMACGTPVIGSTVGSIRHAVVPGVSGCLVPPRDAAALAAQLLAWQARPPLVRALGRGAAQRVRTLFTWDRVGAELAAVYRALAPAARPQRRRLGQAAPPAAACL